MQEFAPIKSGNVVLPTRTADRRSQKTVRVRCVTTPDPTLAVAPFSLDLCILIGDANGDGIVFTTDYGCLKAKIPTFNTDIREDLNGDGMVFTTDYGVIKGYFLDGSPPKP